MAEDPPGQPLDDELFEDLFADEMRAEEVEDLRRALATRVLMLQRARERGEATEEQLAELTDAAEKLRVLREEALIAGFVEDGVNATLRRRAILDSLDQDADF